MTAETTATGYIIQQFALLRSLIHMGYSVEFEGHLLQGVKFDAQANTVEGWSPDRTSRRCLVDLDDWEDEPLSTAINFMKRSVTVSKPVIKAIKFMGLSMKVSKPVINWTDIVPE